MALSCNGTRNAGAQLRRGVTSPEGIARKSPAPSPGRRDGDGASGGERGLGRRTGARAGAEDGSGGSVAETRPEPVAGLGV